MQIELKKLVCMKPDLDMIDSASWAGESWHPHLLMPVDRSPSRGEGCAQLGTERYRISGPNALHRHSRFVVANAHESITQAIDTR